VAFRRLPRIGDEKLLSGAAVAYLLLVIVFALACPFDRNAATGEWWVYGMSALVTAAGAMQARKPRAVKPAPPRSPLERARHVWAIEREVGIEPWPIFGQEPPEPPRVIRSVPRLDETLPKAMPEDKPVPTNAERLAELRSWAKSPAPKPARKEPQRDWGAVVRKSLREANPRAR
jgi:hypothetical protein